VHTPATVLRVLAAAHAAHAHAPCAAALAAAAAAEVVTGVLPSLNALHSVGNQILPLTLL